MEGDYLFRRATVADVGQIAELYEKNFPEHIMVHKKVLNNHSYLEKKLNNQNEIWTVAEKEGKIIGVAVLRVVYHMGFGELSGACIAKPFRKKGIFHQLCKKLIDEAKNQGLGFIEGFARGDEQAVQKTLAKLGFKVYGVAPRFEIARQGNIKREQFVHMGIELKPGITEGSANLIPIAQILYDKIKSQSNKVSSSYQSKLSV